MKRFLVIMGAVFALSMLVVLGAVGFMGVKAYMSAEANRTTAVAAVQDISKTWDVSGRDDIVTPALLRVAQTPQGSRAFRIFKRLGQLQKATDASQVHYGISANKGTSATIEFTGHFANGTAKVIVKLHSFSGPMRVLGIKTENTKLVKNKNVDA